MPQIEIEAPRDKIINVEITLPTSKSISNRLLIMKELFQGDFTISHLSASEDTRYLVYALREVHKNQSLETHEIYVGNAGTAYRFLTTFLAVKAGRWILKGTERMHNRPIDELVCALRKLGANIQYLEKNGFPPLLIIGQKLTSVPISLKGNVSSQFISALMLIASEIENGLEINFSERPVSFPFIEMTAKLLKKTGVICTYNQSMVIAKKTQIPASVHFDIEPDWTSASYWYLLATFAKKAKIFFSGLSFDSIQGDFATANYFEQLGIITKSFSEGIEITKTRVSLADSFRFNFLDHPDLAQTIMVALCGLNKNAVLTGLNTLNQKETRRLKYMVHELNKVGFEVQSKGNSVMQIFSKEPFLNQITKPQVATYNDHRFFLAFAALCMLFENVVLDDPETIKKSYPHFLLDLKKAGFVIKKTLMHSKKK